MVWYAPGERVGRRRHEPATLRQIAERLARLKGYEFAGEYDCGVRYDRPVYFVPSATLVSDDTTDNLGIRGEDDLFGGVVPHAFVATKTITHPLAGDGAARRRVGRHAFARAVEGAVLHGYSAFSFSDARRAGELLLRKGRGACEAGASMGGRGQVVANDRDQLEAALRAIDAAELASCGVALEENLVEVSTYSVGQVRVGTLLASYFGTQKLTADEHGKAVYGGSDLVVARGDFDALLALDLGDEAAQAVTQARTYDRAAREHYKGFFASRRNYDVVRGVGFDGAPRCGVLEQSWRIGGASSAEIAALEVFAADETRQVARACCTEVYGAGGPVPARAVVYYQRRGRRSGLHHQVHDGRVRMAIA